MTKLRDNPAQLSLRFDQSPFPPSALEGIDPAASNVVKLDFSKREASGRAHAFSLDERAILEDVLSEAKKLKW